jgi:DNA-binding LacI/PurR family transcriptional regulator
MVTMRDVAKAAGVSQASVSYAYSGSPKVSAAQREQIFSVAAQLGYTGPNIAGSSLRLGRIGTVGVLVPGTLAKAVEDPSTMLLMKGIVEVGELADVALTLLPVDRLRSKSQPGTIMPAALRGLVDGVVMHALPDGHPAVEAVLSRNIPAVAIDSPRLPNLPYVTIDHRAAGESQMNHVLALGHRRIGIITDRLSSVSAPGVHPLTDVDAATETYIRERLAGYREAIKQFGLSDDEVMLIESEDIDLHSGEAAAEELITRFAPTAIVATSDPHAVAAMKLLAAKGISIPGEVSVIGFDDAPIADLVGLTTVHQPLVQKGRTAAECLLDLLAGRARRYSVMTTYLIVRSSTGPARAHDSDVYSDV